MSMIQMDVSKLPIKPESGVIYIFVDNDKHIKTIDETGTVFDLTTGTGGTAATENFSYNKIKAGKTVTIPEDQQMIVAGDLIIEGTLINNGSLVKIP